MNSLYTLIKTSTDKNFHYWQLILIGSNSFLLYKIDIYLGDHGTTVITANIYNGMLRKPNQFPKLYTTGLWLLGTNSLKLKVLTRVRDTVFRNSPLELRTRDLLSDASLSWSENLVIVVVWNPPLVFITTIANLTFLHQKYQQSNSQEYRCQHENRFVRVELGRIVLKETNSKCCILIYSIHGIVIETSVILFHAFVISWKKLPV